MSDLIKRMILKEWSRGVGGVELRRAYPAVIGRIAVPASLVAALAELPSKIHRTPTSCQLSLGILDPRFPSWPRFIVTRLFGHAPTGKKSDIALDWTPDWMLCRGHGHKTLQVESLFDASGRKKVQLWIHEGQRKRRM